MRRRSTFSRFAWPCAHFQAQDPSPAVLASPLESSTAVEQVWSRIPAKSPGSKPQRFRLGRGFCEAQAALKREAGGDLVAVGSTELLHTLMAHDLVDELRLMIDPVILGGGKRFFRDDGRLTSLRLVASEVTSTGAILATYARDAR